MFRSTFRYHNFFLIHSNVYHMEFQGLRKCNLHTENLHMYASQSQPFVIIARKRERDRKYFFFAYVQPTWTLIIQFSLLQLFIIHQCRSVLSKKKWKFLCGMVDDDDQILSLVSCYKCVNCRPLWWSKLFIKERFKINKTWKWITRFEEKN